MLSGDLPASAHFHPEASLTVEGVAADAVSWSCDRELGMSVPGIVDATNESGAEGEVVIAPPRAGVNGGSSPWRTGENASPAPSSTAVLALALSPDHSYPVGTGYLTAPGGGMWDGAVSSKIIDPIDTLSVPLEWEPLQAKYPPLGPGAAYRYIGLTNAYVVDRAMRDAGWFSTPPVTSAGVLDAPMCGSLLPRKGRLEETGTSLPSRTARTGMPQAACPMGDVKAVFRLDDVTLGNFEMFLEVDPTTSTAGTVRWDVIDESGSGKGYRLKYDQASKTFSVLRAERSSTPGVTTEGEVLVSLVLTAADHRVSVRIRRFQNDTGTVKEVAVRAVSSATTTESTTLAGSYTLVEGAMWRVYLTTTDTAYVGAFGIDDPATAWDTWAWVPNTDHSFTFGTVDKLSAIPRITGGTTALDVLRDQSEAEVAAWGFHEDGRIFYKTRGWVTSRPLSRTLTSADLVDYGWVHDTTSARSSVTITRRSAAMQCRKNPTCTVWQGRGDSLDPGEVGSLVMAPDADTDWLKVDAAFDEVGVTDGSATAWNAGVGSFWGGAIIRTDGTDAWAHLPADRHLSGSVSQVDSTTWSFDYSVVDPLPETTASVELRTPESTGLRRRDVGLPVLRSFAVTRWLDRSSTLAASSDKRAPRLEHDVDWHVQDATARTDLHDWLVSQVTTARPRLTGVRIKPDPRLQVGDKVRVLDDRPDGTGADVTGFVTAKRLSGRAGVVEMSIDVVQL